MDIPIDPKRRDGRVVKMFPEDAHNKVVDANVGSLYGLRVELVWRNLQAEPISTEHCHLLMGNREVSAFRNAFR